MEKKENRGGKREGAGRTGLGEGHKRYTLVLKIEDIEKIEGNRNAFVREAIAEKLNKVEDNLI